MKSYLTELELHKFHHHYTQVKIIMKLNLVILLTDAKLFSYQYKYKNRYDELINQAIKKVFFFNLNSK